MALYYSSLSQQDKALFDKLESIFVHHPSVNEAQFSKICFMLGNKYKQKS